MADSFQFDSDLVREAALAMVVGVSSMPNSATSM
jgi:hypothetical protein